jgi:FdhD protein
MVEGDQANQPAGALPGEAARRPGAPGAPGPSSGGSKPIEVAGIASPAVGRRAAPLPVRHAGQAAPSDDLVAVEEPLEIRLAGETVAVVMRSPGDDHLLALGYLYGEGIIGGAADVCAIFHCGRPGDEGYGNTVEVSPASGARIAWARLDASRRVGVTTSACGVCGRAAVEDLLSGLAPMPLGPPIGEAEIAGAVAALRRHQPTWDATGGTHAAALLARGGALLAAHEDVGRHNAVDKVVGALLLARAAGATAEPAVLAMSGRGGFEIVQKAARAGVPVVACVSAPTTLAVEVARAAGVTLCCFVRGERLNVYAGGERLSG